MKAKPGELKLAWSKRERDLEIAWGGEGAASWDGHLLHSHFCSRPVHPRNMLDDIRNLPFDATTFTQELEKRGYDLKTLKFSIQKKKTAAL